MIEHFRYLIEFIGEQLNNFLKILLLSPIWLFHIFQRTIVTPQPIAQIPLGFLFEQQTATRIRVEDRIDLITHEIALLPFCQHCMKLPLNHTFR